MFEPKEKAIKAILNGMVKEARVIVSRSVLAKYSSTDTSASPGAVADAELKL